MTDFTSLLDQFRAYLASHDDALLGRFLEGFDWQMPAREFASRSLPVVDLFLPVHAGLIKLFLRILVLRHLVEDVFGIYDGITRLGMAGQEKAQEA